MGKDTALHGRVRIGAFDDEGVGRSDNIRLLCIKESVDLAESFAVFVAWE
jgi:hypothetical protein